MSRDATSRSQKVNDTAMQYSKQYGSQGEGLQSYLTPLFTQMAQNPQGMSPNDISAARTASMESTGGSIAGATGEGNLEAARTGNAGGYQAALRDAARRGIATNASNALKVQNLNTALKEQQRQEGVRGLQGLQSEDQAASIGALAPANDAIANQIKAGQSGWFQNMLGLGNMMANVYKAYKSGSGNSGGGGGDQ